MNTDTIGLQAGKPASLQADKQIESKKKERWYLAIIAFFLVIFAANSYLIWLSVNSSQGLQINKKYEHGIR